MSEIHESCGCGASVTVPITAAGLERASAVVADWRANHRHAAAAPADEHAPEIDSKSSARIESAGRRRVGFTVDPNPGVRPWW